MTPEAYERILLPLQQNTGTEICLRHHELILNVLDKKIEITNHQDFLMEQYFRDFQRYFTIHFLTPTSFKSNGQYQNYPTVRWIFQSLMNKHDSLENMNQLYEEEVLDLLDAQAVITKYHLRSTLFQLEGVKIPSFA